MIIDLKHIQVIRQLGLIILLSVFTSSTVFSQLTKKQLDNLYKYNQDKELEQIFISIYNREQTAVSEFSSNDTVKKINEIFNVILPKKQVDENVSYFIHQPFFPRIIIDDTELNTPINFFTTSIYGNLKPIGHSLFTINAILDFIGSNPYDSPIVKEYLKDKQNIKKSKLNQAERLIANYDNKTKFIGKYLHLPTVLGKIDRSMTPYKINKIRFNSDLTEVEIEYDLTWRGATEVYKLVDGKWKLERTIIEWIH